MKDDVPDFGAKGSAPGVAVGNGTLDMVIAEATLLSSSSLKIGTSMLAMVVQV